MWRHGHGSAYNVSEAITEGTLSKLERVITLRNFVKMMLEYKEYAFHTMNMLVMKKKEEEERRLQSWKSLAFF